MATVEIDSSQKIKPEEFDQKLKEAMENSSPLDDLLELADTLKEYEIKYNMSSSVFYERFNQGELGDDMDFIRWAGRYYMFLKGKRQIEMALMRAALQGTETAKV